MTHGNGGAGPAPQLLTFGRCGIPLIETIPLIPTIPFIAKGLR